MSCIFCISFLTMNIKQNHQVLHNKNMFSHCNLCKNILSLREFFFLSNNLAAANLALLSQGLLSKNMQSITSISHCYGN